MELLIAVLIIVALLAYYIIRSYKKTGILPKKAKAVHVPYKVEAPKQSTSTANRHVKPHINNETGELYPGVQPKKPAKRGRPRKTTTTK